MNRPRIAYLAPEIPSVSATFVYREILALREQGIDVTCFSLHPVADENLSPDGRPFLAETDTVYGDFGRMVLGFIHMFERHPVRTLAVLGLAVRDTLRGRFSNGRQRLRVLVQAIAGLSISPRLEAAGVSHLHVHFAHSPATVAMYAARGANIGFSVTSHANDLYVEASLLAEKVARAKSFVTISEANRRFLAEELGALGETVELVHCGVNLEEFAPSDDGKAAGGPVVFALGRLVPKKGFDLLIRAMKDVIADCPDAKLRLAGDGPQNDELRSLVAQLGLEQSVTFLGALEKDPVRREMNGCDVFVLPCRIDPNGGDVDGIPVCLMEAMATGVPVVSAPISGIPELIENQKTGLLVDSENIPELAGAVGSLIADDTLRETLGSEGRAFVAREFNARENARRLADLMLADDSETEAEKLGGAQPQTAAATQH